MTRIDAARATPSPATPDPRRLRAVAAQLEGVFVAEMFKAMRATVPEGGIADGGAGEEMFTAMMDGQLAESVPSTWTRGIAANIARQMGLRR